MTDEKLKNEIIENLQVVELDKNRYQVFVEKPVVGSMEFDAKSEDEAKHKAIEWLGTEGIDSVIASWVPAVSARKSDENNQ